MNPESLLVSSDATSSIEIQEEEPVPNDERWFGRFEQLFEPVDFAIPQGPLREKWQSFLLNESRNPDLRLSYDKDGIRQKIEAWEVLKKDIEVQESNELLKQAYIDKINQQLSFQRAKWFSMEGDSGAFQTQMERIFPAPDPARFGQLVGILKSEISSALNSRDTPVSVRVAVAKLAEQLPENESHDIAYQPTKQTLESVFQENGYISSVVEETLYLDRDNKTGKYIQKDSFNAEDFARYLVKVYANHAIDWKAEITNTRDTIAVDHKNKRTLIPQGRVFRKHEMLKLGIEEVGHTLTGNLARFGSVKLFSIGLVGYEESEEGFLQLLKMQYERSYENKEIDLNHLGHEDRYLALGLAYGFGKKKEEIAGNDRRDFREVFEIMRLYYSYKDALKQSQNIGLKVVDEGGQSASTDLLHDSNVQKALMVCSRLFAGTDGSDKGCNPKIGIYYSGIYKVLEAGVRDPNIYGYALFGKKNITNPQHNILAMKTKLTKSPAEPLSE